ncbi:hypothetical protein LTR28_004997 [Elasticomyces elasticus]|nr:hypothetical protein LTR28_004997 [Elasticomyces elasticus]
MPITQTPYPILSLFLSAVEATTGMPPQPLEATPEQRAHAAKQEEEAKPRKLPKGVVLGADGKPFGAWAAMAKQKTTMPTTVSTSTPPAQSTAALEPPADCPPDVEQLGRSSWTLLHTIAASYPEAPTPTQQSETRQFIQLFGKMYPCWVCADDFRSWMREGNEPRVSNRSEFGKWMCEAHNAVNVKLGKESFDCSRWDERWRTGWKDGRCD